MIRDELWLVAKPHLAHVRCQENRCPYRGILGFSICDANHRQLRLLSTANELFPEHHAAALRLLGAGGEWWGAARVEEWGRGCHRGLRCVHVHALAINTHEHVLQTPFHIFHRPSPKASPFLMDAISTIPLLVVHGSRCCDRLGDRWNFFSVFLRISTTCWPRSLVSMMHYIISHHIHNLHAYIDTYIL